ncbi:hypothetical protein Nepgr_009722 [Nepenthes gracilis]|uniref:phytol kinase n=1 Tax=Nepenthes gracilis TaxID=150966 RepID=A0AAD3SB97_NEPGR|nr:hypothetical protein Nepgr_009722 [Nepenthes gracilis]
MPVRAILLLNSSPISRDTKYHCKLTVLRRRFNTSPEILRAPESTRIRESRCFSSDPTRISPKFIVPNAFQAGGFAEMVFQDVGATALVLAGSFALVSAFESLTQRNIIQQSLSRKLVHVLSGLLFMASWALFSTSTEARYFASLVPFTNCLRLLINGMSLATDERLLKSVSREGKPEELLRGPLYYVLMLIFCAIIFWRESPVGVISLAMMCGGDGVADIIGRRFGFVKLPYNQKKSWAGSISMFAFGFLISFGMLYYFSALGYYELNWTETAQRVALVSLVATAVESLPMGEVIDDNISVPLSSMITAYMTFGF